MSDEPLTCATEIDGCREPGTHPYGDGWYCPEHWPGTPEEAEIHRLRVGNDALKAALRGVEAETRTFFVADARLKVEYEDGWNDAVEHIAGGIGDYVREALKIDDAIPAPDAIKLWRCCDPRCWHVGPTTTGRCENCGRATRQRAGQDSGASGAAS